MQKEVSTAVLATTKTFHRSFSVFLLYFIGHRVGDQIAINVVFVVESEFGAGRDILDSEKCHFVEICVGVIVRDSVDRTIGTTRMVDEARGTAHLFAVDGIDRIVILRVCIHLFAVFGFGDLVVSAFHKLPVPLLLVRESFSKIFFGDSPWLTKLIEDKKIVVHIVITISSGTSTICLCVGDHFPAISCISTPLSHGHWAEEFSFRVDGRGYVPVSINELALEEMPRTA